MFLFFCTLYWCMLLQCVYEGYDDREPPTLSSLIPISDLRGGVLYLALCCNREVKYETKHMNVIRRVCKIWGLDVLTVSEAGMS